jgi:hypothetical protein
LTTWETISFSRRPLLHGLFGGELSCCLAIHPLQCSSAHDQRSEEEVKLFMCILEGKQGGEGIVLLILNIGIRWKTWSASCSDCFTHGEKGWVGPRARLDVLEKIILSCRCQSLQPRSLYPQPSCYTNWATPANDQRGGAKTYHVISCHVVCLKSCLHSFEGSGGWQANFILSEPVNGKLLRAWCVSGVWTVIFLSIQVFWHVMHCCWVSCSQLFKRMWCMPPLRVKESKKKMALCSLRMPGTHCHIPKGLNTQLHCCRNIISCVRVLLQFVLRRNQWWY